MCCFYNPVNPIKHSGLSTFRGEKNGAGNILHIIPSTSEGIFSPGEVVIKLPQPGELWPRPDVVLCTRAMDGFFTGNGRIESQELGESTVNYQKMGYNTHQYAIIGHMMNLKNYTNLIYLIYKYFDVRMCLKIRCTSNISSLIRNLCFETTGFRAIFRDEPIF